jgi:clan AA aspartic protease
VTGRVFGRQPRMEVALRLPNQPDLQIEFVIDTGFDGFLCLPAAAVAALGLSFDQRIITSMADGRTSSADLYQATILWDGAERAVTVLALGHRPLLGTALLVGHDLHIHFADAGTVTARRF